MIDSNEVKDKKVLSLCYGCPWAVEIAFHQEQTRTATRLPNIHAHVSEAAANTLPHLRHRAIGLTPVQRAKLMNIGAKLAMKAGFPCLVLHDVDPTAAAAC
ncbi:hypothetical protein MSG28_006636 [Choristoneura fumiferana]|uniref:Uncharacterized protein n=1 Tax=Choristoneura fumiferana TaxID=7141 RepID=A0ACC0JKX2_CHOFU|nr:hypothetical protein MSG28_006636 [Choristoneura fumiferana]